MFQFLLIILVTDVGGDTVCPWGRYGEACDKNCSERCRMLPVENIVHCDKISGRCSEGCIAGWYDDKCNQECSQNCINNTCNHQDGACTLGCKDGKQGTFCEVSEDENDEDDNTTIPSKKANPVIVTVIVGVLILLLISSMVGYFCLHQRCARRRQLIADKESDGLISATPTRARRDVRADQDLRAACCEGNLAEVKRTLDTGRTAVNCRGGGGRTPSGTTSDRQRRTWRGVGDVRTW